MTLPTTTHQLHLVRHRSDGPPDAHDFEIAEVPLPALGTGQVLVRNSWLSLDPYMLARMDAEVSHTAPFVLRGALEGGAVGEVIGSRAAGLPVGTVVSHFAGLREHSVLDASGAVPVDATTVPASAYLGVLGDTGLTAYVALTRTAPVKPGDVVLVTSAAGAVGTAAGQLARHLGASRVIGSAGGPDKVRLLTEELGFDAAIDHRGTHLRTALAELAPGGVDVLVDNVGGAQLEAGIDAMRPGGRIALVGAISEYVGRPHGVGNLYDAVKKRLTLRGMRIETHLDLYAEYHELAVPLVADGSLRGRETVLDGRASAPAGFPRLFDGSTVGKLLVRLG